MDKEFKKAGFYHEQIKRVGRVGLFRRRAVNGPVRWHYEVVKISRHNGYNVGTSGALIEAAETYPGASLWGIQGWTCTTLDMAEAKYKKVCSRRKKRALQYA